MLPACRQKWCTQDRQPWTDRPPLPPKVDPYCCRRYSALQCTRYTLDPVNPLPTESPKLPPRDMRVMNRTGISPSTPVCPFPAALGWRHAESLVGYSMEQVPDVLEVPLEERRQGQGEVKAICCWANAGRITESTSQVKQLTVRLPQESALTCFNPCGL